jgi:hypothetical protein
MWLLPQIPHQEPGVGIISSRPLATANYTACLILVSSDWQFRKPDTTDRNVLSVRAKQIYSYDVTA